MEIIIKSDSKELARFFAEKERGQAMNIQQLSKTISFMLLNEKKHNNATGLHCLCRHFSVWFEDIKNDRVPDFGSPCQGCRNQGICHQNNYPWMDMILPILEEQDIIIDLAVRESGKGKGMTP